MRNRGGPAPDVRPRPAVDADRTDAHDGAVVVQIPTGPGHHAGRRPGGVEREPGLHHGTLRPGAHPGGVGATAAHQAERGDDHGLARARLARDDGEAGVRFEYGLIDHPEARDAQLLQHSGHAIPGPRRSAQYRTRTAQYLTVPARSRTAPHPSARFPSVAPRAAQYHPALLGCSVALSAAGRASRARAARTCGPVGR